VAKFTTLIPLLLLITNFFNSHSRGWSPVDPLGTVATDWPILLAPGDYDDGEFGGMKIGRGNRSTRRIPTSSTTLSTTNPI
jgi:hypothetical protein